MRGSHRCDHARGRCRPADRGRGGRHLANDASSDGHRRSDSSLIPEGTLQCEYDLTLAAPASLRRCHAHDARPDTSPKVLSTRSTVPVKPRPASNMAVDGLDTGRRGGPEPVAVNL